ncbi:MAG: RNA-binding protein [Candidatus Marinimicrobia bacterium]|nr:RNA-binding protein [Candidatus Neomarinimicrobiota bacterium]
MKELLDQIIRELVDKPDDVTVREVETDSMVVYEIRVGDGDVGKVIGRQGRTATALRTLVSAITAKGGDKRAVMEIIEDR